MKKVANVVLNEFTNDSRVWKISKSLGNLGYDPIVVAMHNDNLSVNEIVEGVQVHRVRLTTRSWWKWKPIQLLKYIEFLVRTVWRFRRSDIVHCNDLNALPVGVLIKLIGKGVQVIYDCHEYETEVKGTGVIEKTVRKFLERTLIRHADKVITVSDSIANEYVRLYKIPKPSLVLNCPAYKEQKKRNLLREELAIRDDQTIFLYQGGMTEERGIEILLGVFSELDSDKNVLVCMGYGPLENLVKSTAKSSKNIFFHPAVAPNVLLSYTSSADYGILFYEDTCLNHRYCSPNKIFEYLMAGLPVLTSNLFEMKRLVQSESVGVVASSNTVEGFRFSITECLNQDYETVKRNVVSARRKYCWENQEKVLSEVYFEGKS